MRGVAALAVVFAAFLLGGAAAQATTPTFTLSGLTASFSSPHELGGVPSAICPPAGPGCTASPPTQVRWGTPTGSNRSGLGFLPVGGTHALDSNFVIGTLTHFNWETVGGTGVDRVDLTVNLTAATAEGNVTFHLPFTLGIDETPNVAPCAYTPVVSLCPDAILLPGGSTSTSVSAGGRTYTLTVLGFTSSPSGTVAESKLVTQENADNVGYLVAQLSRDNTAPVAADDTGAVSSGDSTAIPVLGNDTDAEHDPLTPSVATPPLHGTAVVNPDGTITYTAASSFAGTDTFTYTDSDGFASSAPATVTIAVTDATDPVVTVPSSPVVAEASAPGGATVTYDASSSDNVDGSLPATCTPPPGSTFPLGTTTVTCTSTDAAGNTGSSSFDVLVQDTTAPALGAVPSDIVTEAAGPGGSVVTYTAPIATDAVDPSPTVACVPPSGSTFALGTQTVSCTATDAAGNTSAPSTFHVLVQDTTAPDLTVPSSFSIFSPDPAGMAVTYSTSASDAVDPHPAVVCTPPSGATFGPGTTTVSCTATDASGNHTTKSFAVTVVTNRPPVCTAVRPTIATLWPPDHQLVLVGLTGATDPDTGDSVSYAVTQVTQDEALVGAGSGNFSPDAKLAGGSVYLRAERDGSGDGRVYTVTYRVTDTHSASCTGTVRVTVAHDQAHAALLTPGVSVGSLG